MAKWIKTLHGDDLTIERAFNPLQIALVRLGYEVRKIIPQKKIKFRARGSIWALHDHESPHKAILVFKEKKPGVFRKRPSIDVTLIFSSGSLIVSSRAQKHWQEIADKLQIMLSDPTIFLQLRPPNLIPT